MLGSQPACLVTPSHFCWFCKGALIRVMLPKKKLFETNEVGEEKLFWNQIKFQSESTFEIGMKIENYYVFSNVYS